MGRHVINKLKINFVISDLSAVKKIKQGKGLENGLGWQMLFWKDGRGRPL